MGGSWNFLSLSVVSSISRLGEAEAWLNVPFIFPHHIPASSMGDNEELHPFTLKNSRQMGKSYQRQPRQKQNFLSFPDLTIHLDMESLSGLQSFSLPSQGTSLRRSLQGWMAMACCLLTALLFPESQTQIVNCQKSIERTALSIRRRRFQFHASIRNTPDVCKPST